MNTDAHQKTGEKLRILTRRGEEILRTIHFYRYMTALDVAYRLFSPASLVYARKLLSGLAGGADEQPNHYLYRFQLPRISPGNTEKIYTLGSRGRDFLAHEAGLPVDWYFRPEKVKHLSFGHVVHHLTLTRFLVAAHAWSEKHPDFRIDKTRISYELAPAPPRVKLTSGRKTDTLPVVPDAWLLFEQLQEGQHVHWAPVLLEIDRGTEYQQKFKRQVRARIEFIRSGAYQELFGEQAVIVAYATTGNAASYRESRRAAMATWTKEVLSEAGLERWASVFRFCGFVYDALYTAPVFWEPVWYRLDQPEPAPLLVGAQTGTAG